MDEQKFHDFLNRFVGDLGAAVAAGGVVLGDQFGLYAALAECPQTPRRPLREHGHRCPLPGGAATWSGRRRIRRV